MNGRWAMGFLTMVTCAAWADEPKDPTFRDDIVKKMQPSVGAEEQALRNLRNRPDGGLPTLEDIQRVRSRFEAARKPDAEWLKQKVAASGWPSIEAVGDPAAVLAFRLAQAGDPAARKEWLALALKLPAGACPKFGLALLADRVAADENRPSVYGMVVTGPEDKLVPFGGGAVAKIDERRKDLGLRPWAEHLAYGPKYFIWLPAPVPKAGPQADPKPKEPDDWQLRACERGRFRLLWPQEIDTPEVPASAAAILWGGVWHDEPLRQIAGAGRIDALPLRDRRA
jgi:hypothetical protein